MLRLKKKKIIIPLAALCVLVGVSAFIPIFRNSILVIFRFPLNVLSIARSEIKGIFFYRKAKLENERLIRQISLFNQKLNRANEAFLENRRLNALLSLKENSNFKCIASRVIGRDPDNWSSIVIIDKGTSSGIRNSYSCVNFLGLVGKVVEASRNMSKVLLVNDPNFGVSAIVQRSRQQGLVAGSVSGSLIMKYLSRESDIQPEDIIVTSGLNSNFPKGLLIGSVVSLGMEFSGLSHYAVIRPAVDLLNLEELLVIIP